MAPGPLLITAEWSLYSFVYCGALQAMDAIETMDPAAFTDYLKKYQNTICGRHPIGILLNVSTAD